MDKLPINRCRMSSVFHQQYDIPKSIWCFHHLVIILAYVCKMGIGPIGWTKGNMILKTLTKQQWIWYSSIIPGPISSLQSRTLCGSPFCLVVLHTIPWQISGKEGHPARQRVHSQRWLILLFCWHKFSEVRRFFKASIPSVSTLNFIQFVRSLVTSRSAPNRMYLKVVSQQIDATSYQNQQFVVRGL